MSSFPTKDQIDAAVPRLDPEPEAESLNEPTPRPRTGVLEAFRGRVRATAENQPVTGVILKDPTTWRPGRMAWFTIWVLTVYLVAWGTLGKEAVIAGIAALWNSL